MYFRMVYNFSRHLDAVRLSQSAPVYIIAVCSGKEQPDRLHIQEKSPVRVRRYRLHCTKHYIISLSDNRSQRDDRVWFHSDKCREKSASVSTCCNIYRSHASVEKLGSLHDSVTSPVGSVQDTVSSCGLHPRCVPWTGHVPWVLYEDSDDYCSI